MFFLPFCLSVFFYVVDYWCFFLGLETFAALEIAEPFAYPVDVNVYPTYCGTIAFPTDLETINKRISNGFYR